ncbi:MAG TPA: hypothetical protein VMY34_08365 [Acidimicrobiales bacterium]|nr:hypothetical protein [Acidimicrobiales bacterium]
MTTALACNVTVEPATFSLVLFESAPIASLAAAIAEAAGIPATREIRIEVDERTPLGRTQLVSLDPITVTAESGAFEDPTHLRHLGTDAVIDVLGRFLFRAADRLDLAFGHPPDETDLTAEQLAVWDAYCLGRLSRRGFSPRQPRRRYQVRTRLGFTDVVDEVFDRLWRGEGLSWTDLDDARSAALREIV